MRVGGGGDGTHGRGRPPPKRPAVTPAPAGTEAPGGGGGSSTGTAVPSRGRGDGCTAGPHPAPGAGGSERAPGPPFARISMAALALLCGAALEEMSRKGRVRLKSKLGNYGSCSRGGGVPDPRTRSRAAAGSGGRCRAGPRVTGRFVPASGEKLGAGAVLRSKRAN